MRGFLRFLAVFAFFCSWGATSQISNFSLTVNKTDETCQGNGTLNFAVTNTSPGAQLLYKIFKLPSTNPMSIQASAYVGGLTAGTYKVVAIQSLNSASNTKEVQVTIQKHIVPFNFSLSTRQANCATGGSLVLTAVSGTISECEIISGPVTRPRQAGTIFPGLPTGTYNVRAYNECGLAKVKTYTLSVVSGGLAIGDTQYIDNRPVCDSITISNTISSTGGAINYPVTVQHVLSPMTISGQNLVINQTFTSGDANSFDVTARVPRFLTDSYDYDLNVIDNCGSLYSKMDNVVDPSLSLLLSPGEAICAQKFLKLSAAKFTGSYTVNFVSAPAGFNPADFQTSPQGPFTDGNIAYGDQTHPLPFGIYVVEITDSCGRTVTQSLELEFIKPVPSYSGYNNGCFSPFGGIGVAVLPQKIVTVTVLAAPAEYTATHTLPYDASSSITLQGTVSMRDLPKGTYKIAITDDCGFVYDPKNVVIPDYKDKGFNIAALPGCTPGLGGIRFRSGNGPIYSAQITAAPAGFGHSLPYDLSASLATDGAIYIGDLPAGNYAVKGLDMCGVTKELPITVKGYVAPTTPFVYTPNCGTFSVKVTDDGNGAEAVSYWLQKYFPDTDTWGHPQTAVAYAIGTEPVSDNGIRLSNNSVRNNLAYSGKFRIVKRFETFSNASAQNTSCISILGEFEYYEGLSINAVYTMACAGSPRDIVIDYSGTAAAFRISKKNGAPFSLNNGTSNIFRGLEPAEYVFEIEDACGNIIPQWYESADLPSMGDAQQPTDLVECLEAGVSISSVGFRLRDKDEEVLGPLYSSMYTITYYNNEVDADAGVNPLPDYITNIHNGQQIFVRLQHNQVNICHKVTSFKLYVGESQTANIETTGVICNDGTLALTAPAGFDAYVWSNGQTSQTIYVAEAGTYTVEVRRAYGSSYCSATASTDVIKSSVPRMTSVDVNDWTYDKNAITVNVEGQGVYQYSLNGTDYTSSNVFDNLETGVYNVFVKDANGCGMSSQEVVLLNYPKFFTPNGDGENDKWRIKYSVKEPDFYVSIFDRYGKLVTTMKSNSDGWDGTLNGVQLPSTDYWFVVNREDGRELRGHFSLMR